MRRTASPQYGEPETVDETSPPTRLVVADDHDLVRMALTAMLRDEPDLEVVGEAKDGKEALDLCRRLHPDLVLMDVQMPEMDGLAATREIKREAPGIAVLIVTAFEDPDYLLEAIRAGAAGYVLKHAACQELLGAVRSVLDGESPLHQDLAMRLIQRLAEETGTREPKPRTVHEHPGKRLSPREMEVLRLLTRGRTNRQIAGDLYLSLSTVKGHLERIIRKLGVSDRTQAAVRAIEFGLIETRREKG